MVVSSTNIEALPNEILISVLSNFSTLSLLPLALTSRRIHDLIVRILHHRTLEAAQLKDHKLLLECFHPSTKSSTPYLFCNSLNTRPLNASFEPQELPDSLDALSSLYTSFRPIKPNSNHRAPRIHPAGGWFAPAPTSNSMVDKHEELVCQDIHLESHELFSQLCTITNLVKVGPKRGLFMSCVNVGEGILRVWRDWLAERAKDADDKESEMLWADSKKTVGLRLKVVERETVHVGPPLRTGEDPAVSYTLQYDELVVKTTQLLLMLEQSIAQEVKHSGMLCGLDGEFFVSGYPVVDQPTAVETINLWGPSSEIFAREVYGVS